MDPGTAILLQVIFGDNVVFNTTFVFGDVFVRVNSPFTVNNVFINNIPSFRVVMGLAMKRSHLFV